MGRTPKAAWSYSCGERGKSRVRLFEDARAGLLFLQYRECGQRKAKGLAHRDRELGKAQAMELAALLARGASLPGSATLGSLTSAYLAERTPTKGVQKQKHDRHAAALALEILGAATRVEDLTHRDAHRFVRERFRRGDTRKTAPRGAPIRARQVAYDLAFLQAVFNWACGGGLIARNPFKGFKAPVEKSPRRPVLAEADYRALLGVADRVSPMMRLALTLTWETGHRIGAVRNLRWSDVDLEAGTARWRAEYDKQGHEHVTPLSAAAVEALKMERLTLPERLDGERPVIPGTDDRSTPAPRDTVQAWWKRCERLAELKPCPRRGWHSCRRAFATDLASQPLAHLAAAGGWNDLRTMMDSYIQPGLADMRAVLASRRPS